MNFGYKDLYQAERRGFALGYLSCLQQLSSATPEKDLFIARHVGFELLGETLEENLHVLTSLARRSLEKKARI